MAGWDTNTILSAILTGIGGLGQGVAASRKAQLDEAKVAEELALRRAAQQTEQERLAESQRQFGWTQALEREKLGQQATLEREKLKAQEEGRFIPADAVGPLFGAYGLPSPVTDAPGGRVLASILPALVTAAGCPAVSGQRARSEAAAAAILPLSGACAAAAGRSSAVARGDRGPSGGGEF